MAKQCAFTFESGTQCRGYAVEGSLYCLSHDPDLKEARIARSKKGGEATSYEKLELALPPLAIVNASDVVSAAIQTINEVRAGNLPPKVASTIGYLLGVALKGFEQSELQNRVQTIERVILERSTK